MHCFGAAQHTLQHTLDKIKCISIQTAFWTESEWLCSGTANVKVRTLLGFFQLEGPHQADFDCARPQLFILSDFINFDKTWNAASLYAREVQEELFYTVHRNNHMNYSASYMQRCTID